jgi:hypothetical protein
VTGEPFDRRPRWRREVLRTARLSGATKSVMWVLYDRMRADGKVSVSRRTVADEMGWRHKRRVSEHLRAARNAGFLVTVTEGSYGRTATWQAVFPGDVRVRKTSTLTESENPHPYDPSKGASPQHPITKANPGPVPQIDMALAGRRQPKQTCHVSHGSWSIREPWDYTRRAAS